VGVVYGTMANMAGAAIFESNRDIQFESNLESSQVPSFYD